MKSAKPLNIALIGLGKIARDQHIPAILSLPEFNLVAACDPFGRSDVCPVYKDLTAMLQEHPEIDAISICTPPQVRHEIAKAVIAAGKSVMLEKPPAATLGEAESIRKLAEKNGVTLLAAWHSRFAPAVEQARNWISFHTIKEIQISWRENVREWHKGQKWIFNAGGMGVFDPGINAFSILTRLIDDLVIVKSANLRIPSNCESPIQADIDMISELGVKIHTVLDFLEQDSQTWSINVVSDLGKQLHLSFGGAKLEVDGQILVDEKEMEYVNLYRHFVRLILAKQSDADFSPLRIVSDVLSVGKRFTVEAFIE